MTLIEVLVAVAIFSLISTIGYAAVEQGVGIRTRLDQHRAAWLRFERTVETLREDLRFAVVLPGAQVTPDGNRAAFVGAAADGAARGDGLLNFLRNSRSGYAGTAHSPYARVRYRVDEGTLLRLAVPAPAEYVTEYNERVLLEGIDSITLRYLGVGNRWMRRWNMSTDNATRNLLPRAVEVTLSTQRFGDVPLMFAVGAPL